MKYQMLPRTNEVGARIVDAQHRRVAELWCKPVEGAVLTAAPG